MKQFIFIFLFLISNAVFSKQNTTSCNDTIKLNLTELKNINWEKVKEGEIVEYCFVFTNRTDTSFYIERIQTGDGGCYAKFTGNKKNRVKVDPGQNFYFTVVQLTQGRIGALKRTVNLIVSNANNNRKVIPVIEMIGTVIQN